MDVDIQLLSPAERLLWGYGVTDASHIDLDAIANANGALVKYRPLDGCVWVPTPADKTDVRQTMADYREAMK